MATDPDKLLAKLKQADREVEVAKARYDDVTAKRTALVLATADAGKSRAEIATALGKSITRVQQLYKTARDRAGG